MLLPLCTEHKKVIALRRKLHRLKEDLNKSNSALTATKKKLKETESEWAREIEIFNEGWDAAESGKPLPENAPPAFKDGYRSGRFKDLTRQISELEEFCRTHLESRDSKPILQLEELRSENARLAHMVEDFNDRVSGFKEEIQNLKANSEDWMTQAIQALDEAQQHEFSRQEAEAQAEGLMEALKVYRRVLEESSSLSPIIKSVVRYLKDKGATTFDLAEVLGVPQAVANVLWEI